MDKELLDEAIASKAKKFGGKKHRLGWDNRISLT
jgi:hypothetical protein